MKKHVLLYLALVVGALAIVLVLLRLGQGLQHASAIALPADIPTPRGSASRGNVPWTTNLGNPLALLMLQILVIMLAARACGAAAQRVRQPRVVGEIAAGLLLGPSFVGFVLPDVSRVLFPAASLSALQLISQIGVTLFMFGVGLTVDASQLRGKAHAAVAVSHASILAPFCLGTLLSLALYPRYAPAGVAFQPFALFMGVGMSITAFPVLARIIDERGLAGTSLASMVLTCAAVDDVTAWTLLAFVVALVTSGGAWQSLLTTVTLTLTFLLFLTRYARPPLRRLIAGSGRRGQDPTPTAVALLFGSALFTEAIGIHPLFGAFLIGAVLPLERADRDRLCDRLDSVSGVILLPVFFAFTGLRTNVHLLDDRAAWLVCAAIVAVASIGKIGGGMFAARVTGLDWRVAFGVGALMNTRGLMELVALNLGYELGILSPEIFAMMVLMALMTTVLTVPLLEAAGVERSPAAWREAAAPVRGHVRVPTTTLAFGGAPAGPAPVTGRGEDGDVADWIR
jgi:Kef-type K+ transport system membrane component KefB